LIKSEKLDVMKEEQIRPRLLMEENAKLNAEDIQALLERKSEFVHIPCPACESKDNSVMFEKNGFTFVRCSQCETVFVNPRPTMRMLKEYYGTSKCIKHWNEKIFLVSENARRERIFAPRARRVVELCKKVGVPNQVLIDVGAGFGTFCEEVSALGHFEKVVAVEPSSTLAKTCRKKGLHVIESMIEDVEIDENVSVITNFELIEHLYWPKDFLKVCNKALPKGGYVILSTSNIKGFDLYILGKLSNNIGGPNHLNYFHPKSLEHLCKTCGFEVVEVLTPGKLDAELVRKKILSKELDVSKDSALKFLLIERWDDVGEAFQTFLAENRLSSHLWMIARKV